MLFAVESVWFCYDRKTMRWIFLDTENGRFFVEYVISDYIVCSILFRNVCNLAVTMELALILLLDIITIAHLRTYNKNVFCFYYNYRHGIFILTISRDIQKVLSDANAVESRSTEIRLFKQVSRFFIYNLDLPEFFAVVQSEYSSSC